MINCPPEPETLRRRSQGIDVEGGLRRTYSLEKRVGGVPRHWEPQRVEIPHKRDLLGRFVTQNHNSVTPVQDFESHLGQEINEVQTVTATPFTASTASPMLRGEFVEPPLLDYDQYNAALNQPGAFEEQFHYIDTGDVTVEPKRQELPVDQLHGHFQEEEPVAQLQGDPGLSFHQVFPQQEPFQPTGQQHDHLHGQFETQTDEQSSELFQGHQQLQGHFEEQPFQDNQGRSREPFGEQFAEQQFFSPPTQPPAVPEPVRKPRREVVLAGSTILFLIRICVLAATR